jgi:hypothetical protein
MPTGRKTMTPLDFGRDLPTVESAYRYSTTGSWWHDVADWRVLPVTCTRDATPLDDSNFETARRLLDDAGAVYETHRLGHWGVGWYEIVIIAPDDASLAAAGEIARALDSYPVLDDDDLCERETEEQDRAWRDYAAREYIENLPRISDSASDLIEEYLLYIGPHSSPGMRYVEQHNDGPYFTYDRLTRDETAQLLRAARKWRREGDA